MHKNPRSAHDCAHCVAAKWGDEGEMKTRVREGEREREFVAERANVRETTKATTVACHTTRARLHVASSREGVGTRHPRAAFHVTWLDRRNTPLRVRAPALDTPQTHGPALAATYACPNTTPSALRRPRQMCREWPNRVAIELRDH